MNSQSIFRLILAVVLVVSIGWKAAVLRDFTTDIKDSLVLFLERNNFDVVPGAIIRARQGACELQMIQLAPNGSDRDRFRELAAGADRAFIVVGRTEYNRQPVWWTVLDDLWFRHLRELGLSDHVTPIIAVAASSVCDTIRIPWEKLSSRQSKE